MSLLSARPVVTTPASGERESKVYLQTNIIVQMLSIGGEGASSLRVSPSFIQYSTELYHNFPIMSSAQQSSCLHIRISNMLITKR